METTDNAMHLGKVVSLSKKHELKLSRTVEAVHTLVEVLVSEQTPEPGKQYLFRADSYQSGASAGEARLYSSGSFSEESVRLGDTIYYQFDDNQLTNIGIRARDSDRPWVIGKRLTRVEQRNS